MSRTGPAVTGCQQLQDHHRVNSLLSSRFICFCASNDDALSPSLLLFELWTCTIIAMYCASTSANDCRKFWLLLRLLPNALKKALLWRYVEAVYFVLLLFSHLFSTCPNGQLHGTFYLLEHKVFFLCGQAVMWSYASDWMHVPLSPLSHSDNVMWFQKTCICLLPRCMVGQNLSYIIINNISHIHHIYII